MPPAKRASRSTPSSAPRVAKPAARKHPANAAQRAAPAAAAQVRARGAAGSSSDQPATQQQPRRRAVIEDDDDDADAQAANVHGLGTDNENEPADDDAEEQLEDGAEDMTDVGEEDGDEPASADSDDDDGTKVSSSKLFALMLKQQRDMTRAINQMSQLSGVRVNAMPPQAHAAAASAAFGAAAAAAAAAAPNAAPAQNQPTTLPLDGSTTKFGPGFRAKVVQALATQWFRRVGAVGMLLPAHVATPLAMQACGLDPSDAQQSGPFRMLFKGELSRTGSKVKQQLSNIFVDSLLILNRVAPIADAGAATPPLMAMHKPVFKQLREPPAGFDANDPQYKYFAAWHAKVAPSGELKAFETAESRQLLEVDFFSRCAAKKLLPQAARKWNLASFAYFLLYTQQRLTVKRAAGGGEAYGNLRDGNDALVEIESICKWLMDPVACPTDWPRLIAIRAENPLYGQQQPVVA